MQANNFDGFAFVLNIKQDNQDTNSLFPNYDKSMILMLLTETERIYIYKKINKSKDYLDFHLLSHILGRYCQIYVQVSEYLTIEITHLNYKL